MTLLSEYSKIIGLTQRDVIALTGTPKSTLESYWAGRLKTPSAVLNKVIAVWIDAGGKLFQLEATRVIRERLAEIQKKESAQEIQDA